MQAKLLVLLTAAFINTALGVFVLLKNRKLVVNKLFFYYSIGVGFWVFSNFMIEKMISPEISLLWDYLAFAAASLLPVSLLAFVTAFPMMRGLRSGLDLKIYSWLAVLFFFGSFTPYMVKGVVFNALEVQTQTGPLFPFFALYFATGYVWALIKLFIKGRRSSGIEKLQCQYLLLGLTFAAVFSMGTNLIIPLLVGSWKYAGFGPSSTIVMTGFIAHTIVRYRLLHIHIVLRRSVVYTISIAVAVTGFVLLLSYGEGFLKGAFGFSSLISTAIIALMIAVFFQPLRLYIQRLVDHYFYRETLDYSAATLKVSKSLTSMLNLAQLTNEVYGIINELMHPDRIYIYLGSQQGLFSLALSRNHLSSEIVPPSILREDSRLVSYVSSRLDLVLREELLRVSSEKDIERVVAEMSDLGIDVAVPVILEDNLTAVLLLGPKLSGDIYSLEDIGLLVTLANQSAVAINNARLYEEVRRVRDYNESILANMESGVITVDRDRTVVLCNKAAGRIFESAETEMVGRKIAEIDPLLAEKVAAALDDGATCSNLEIGLKRGEESLPLVLSTSLLSGSGPDAEGAILVFNDISRIKALEEERNQAERLAYIGSLAAGLAHEIKNPLVTVKTMADLLPDRFDDPEFREGFVGLAIKEIERIDLLISQLLGFARPMSAEMTAINITDPLDEMLLILSNRLQERLIEVRKSYPPSPARVLGDGSKMKQVFLNMLLNAIDAMPDGGSLEIVVTISRQDEGDMVMVALANSGQQIPEGLRAKIFTPFYTTKPSGTGLGLSICRKIIHEHGGEIRLVESDDAMTRFNIALPSCAGAALKTEG